MSAPDDFNLPPVSELVAIRGNRWALEVKQLVFEAAIDGKCEVNVRVFDEVYAGRWARYQCATFEYSAEMFSAENGQRMMRISW